MRKWLAGWLSWAADRLYPHYSERLRRESTVNVYNISGDAAESARRAGEMLAYIEERNRRLAALGRYR